MLNGSGDSPQYALDHLDPDRIRLARERLGFTGKKVAELIDKTPSAVSQFESGVTVPDLDTLLRLSVALRVPTKFFIRRSREASMELDACHFRARRSVSQKDRRASVSNGRLLIQLVQILEDKGIVFPQDEVSTFVQERFRPVAGDVFERIEQVASAVRKHWGLGYGPIPNLTRLLESKGIFVFPLADTHKDVDAYSCWAAGRPCIMLALQKSASRARFDAAHELAHLVMHEDAEPGDSEIERQADRFAGAFLAPREGFLAECPRRWNFDAFLRLKGRWRMSVAALVRRAYDLGVLSQSSYTKAFRELSARGYRTLEPGEWSKEDEKPSLLTQAAELLRDRVDLNSLGDEMALYTHEIRQLLARNLSDEVLELLAPKESARAAEVVYLRPSGV